MNRDVVAENAAEVLHKEATQFGSATLFARPGYASDRARAFGCEANRVMVEVGVLRYNETVNYKAVVRPEQVEWEIWVVDSEQENILFAEYGEDVFDHPLYDEAAGIAAVDPFRLFLAAAVSSMNEAGAVCWSKIQMFAEMGAENGN